MAEDLAGRLRELAELRTSGALTEEEFVAAKVMLLHPPLSDGRGAPSPPTPSATPVVAPVHPGAPRLDRGPAPPPVSPGPSGPHSGTDGDPSWVAHVEYPAPSAAAARPGSQGSTATMAAGGLLALLAFFAMPLAQVPFLGSITGADLAGVPGDAGAVRLLWLVPTAAATVAGLAAWLLLGSPPAAQARRAAGCVVALAVAVLLAYLIAFGRLQNQINETGTSSIGVSATDLTGAGFWLTLLGMFVAAIGAGAYRRTTTS